MVADKLARHTKPTQQTGKLLNNDGVSDDLYSQNAGLRFYYKNSKAYSYFYIYFQTDFLINF
jgi:hypothetical protein